MPHLNGDCFEVFLAQLRRAYPEDEILVVLDRAGAHISGEVKWPERMAPLCLPARSPELDPAERWFGELRGPREHYHYGSHSELREHLGAFVLAYNHAERLKTSRGLTPYEFVCREWQRDPELFYRNPTQDTLGPYT